MLTKEECLEALNYLASGQCSYCWKSGNEEVLVYEDANKMLTQLINEHFELKEVHQELCYSVFPFSDKHDEIIRFVTNPPLKFEELKEGMWVWDNLYKFDVRVAKICEKQNYFYVANYDVVGRLVKFEENRFYRKKVE